MSIRKSTKKERLQKKQGQPSHAFNIEYFFAPGEGGKAKRRYIRYISLIFNFMLNLQYILLLILC